MRRMVPEQPPRPFPTPPVSPSGVPGAEPKQWTSAAILGDGREALIEHVGAVYRLRLTSSGKLILTK